MPTLNQLMGIKHENAGRWVRKQDWEEGRYFIPATSVAGNWFGIICKHGFDPIPTRFEGSEMNWSFYPLRLRDESAGRDNQV